MMRSVMELVPTSPESGSLRNRVALDDVPSMLVGDIAALPAEELALLIDEAAEALDRAKRMKERLDGAVDLKYRDRASAARTAAGKDAGIVRFEDGGLVIVADLPKRVKWDQGRLAEAVEVIRHGWRDDPAQYVRTEIKVSEAAYTAWPEAIRRLFEPARTVETGKPSYRFEPVPPEAA